MGLVKLGWKHLGQGGHAVRSFQATIPLDTSLVTPETPTSSRIGDARDTSGDGALQTPRGPERAGEVSGRSITGVPANTQNHFETNKRNRPSSFYDGLSESQKLGAVIESEPTESEQPHPCLRCGSRIYREAKICFTCHLAEAGVTRNPVSKAADDGVPD
jgi:hypothetical protein